jgi:hypothetical protein
MDRDKLVKLLNMTTSKNDGEALNAIRMSNELLQRASVSWDELLALGEKATQSNPSELPSAKPRSEQPREDFREAAQSDSWGQDPFGDRPSPAGGKQARKKVIKVAGRHPVVAVPLVVRVILFPLWVCGEMIVAVSFADELVDRIAGYMMALVVLVVYGGIWLIGVHELARKLDLL